MISSIILAVSLIFALAAIYKLCGDVRYYRTKCEEEVKVNKGLRDWYIAWTEHRLPPQSGLDAEVYENPGAEELRAQKMLATARKRRASKKKYRDARHAKGEIQVFDDNHHLRWVKATDCAWILSGKRWKRVLRSSTEFAEYTMTGAVCCEGTMPNPGRKAA